MLAQIIERAAKLKAARRPAGPATHEKTKATKVARKTAGRSATSKQKKK
jgi:hypothetical protein